MWKYIAGGSFIVMALISGFYLFWNSGMVIKKDPIPTSTTQQTATSTYATTTFSIIYPTDFSLNDSYVYEQFAPKLVHGVKFTVPTTMATGTTLSDDTYLSIEQLPRAKNCTADIYIKNDVKAKDWTDGESGITYSVATTSGAAAGNRYEEQVFALKGTSPCTAVRYFIHSTNIGNYATGTVQEFSRAALLEIFDEIRHSLVFKP